MVLLINMFWLQVSGITAGCVHVRSTMPCSWMQRGTMIVCGQLRSTTPCSVHVR
jgi:hypothetical protein